MERSLSAAVQEALDAGRGEVVAGRRALPLLVMESGAHFALTAELGWLLVKPDGEVRAADPGDEHVLHEAIEQKRAAFELALEEAARAQGLEPDALVLAFPATRVVRAVLTRRMPYLVRLALLWLLPSELRELRADIVGVSRGHDLPLPVRELAAHLVVPE